MYSRGDGGISERRGMYLREGRDESERVTPRGNKAGPLNQPPRVVILKNFTRLLEMVDLAAKGGGSLKVEFKGSKVILVVVKVVI
ncbi:hypothetical protein H5410_013425 [Solanum commersonii]|uniref:Uncharacterized protein n=1 Tax=Solanum commersonii TaxID=4109 RepID=A0A9J6AVQ2_SOLCO|nr:hypothetical protein H5410_013425 [Solanum commersonii]